MGITHLLIKSLMRIKNPTLAHFRHFSSLFTNLPADKALYLRAYKALHLSRILYKSALIYAKQTQFPECSNEHKLIINNAL